MLRIKYELDRLGLRQRDLAERTGLKHQAVSRIINGQEPAWPKRGKRIAQAIGWEGDPAELFEPVEIEVQDGVMSRPYEEDGIYYTEDGERLYTSVSTSFKVSLAIDMTRLDEIERKAQGYREIVLDVDGKRHRYKTEDVLRILKEIELD